jgi:hypothetical protein
MASQNFNPITITPAIVESWKNELIELDKKIDIDRKRRALLYQKIEAVQYFITDKDQQPELPGVSEQPRRSISELTPKEVMFYFLKQKSQPVSISYLRDTITQSGYPIEKFGKGWGYFYALLSRMKVSGEIMRVGEDGDQVILKR